ncbi:MAG: cysteine hydrolase [SAR324 cluster bacterium]|nr:cysteine hydrolase [SAR324 cluster bacterium]
MAVDTFSAHRHNDNMLVVSPESTAVLVIDMLNDFCIAGGAMVLPGAEVLYPPQNAILTAVRESGGTVVFVNDCHHPGLREDREYSKRTPHCVTGSWGAQVVDSLNRHSDDFQVAKHRYSGFFGTDLDLILKDMRIATLIVIGVVTNICVRSTVHDAFFNGYHVVVPEDCVAATGPREQASSLYDIATHFGIVSKSADVIKGLREGVPIVNLITDD